MSAPRSRSALWAAAAALNGAAGIAATRCAGGGCSTCFACAVPAAGVVLLAVLGRRKALPRPAGGAGGGGLEASGG